MISEELSRKKELETLKKDLEHLDNKVKEHEKQEAKYVSWHGLALRLVLEHNW